FMKIKRSVVYQIFLSILVLTSINMVILGQTAHELKVQADVQNVTHQMKGGIGASWHAFIHDIPLKTKNTTIRCVMLIPGEAHMPEIHR
ncbi:MAG: hypothetical protein U5K79_07555, partial [Cyclobacteriaceae bacterium]|nr:hypothetical protein [Cyclobacteriaceae bacterium]